MNKAEERDAASGRFNDKLFYTVGAMAILFFVGWIITIVWHEVSESACKPYALKQNGDTLFIPTQVVVKHDTLVVIRTEERRPASDTLFPQLISVSSSGTLTYVSSGGWTYPVNDEPKPYKQRDTIYEHKIIYY